MHNLGWQAVAERQRCRECICQYPPVNSYQPQSPIFFRSLLSSIFTFSHLSFLSLPLPANHVFLTVPWDCLVCCSLRLRFQRAAEQQSWGGCVESDQRAPPCLFCTFTYSLDSEWHSNSFQWCQRESKYTAALTQPNKKKSQLWSVKYSPSCLAVWLLISISQQAWVVFLAAEKKVKFMRKRNKR